MKKWVRKAISVALSGALLLGASGMAGAAGERDGDSSFTRNNNAANSDISSFTLIKDYDSINPTSATPYSQSPAETLSFTVEKYAVWNSGQNYSSASNIPEITIGNITENYGDATYESGTEAKNTGDRTVTVTLPTYSYVGDYWYKVTETTGSTAGVYYGTNDGETTAHTSVNGSHNGIYYLHVQVVNNPSYAPATTSATADQLRQFNRMVTLHKTSPSSATLSNSQYNALATQDSGKLYEQADSNKVNAIENQYYAGDLEIHKDVTGNAGDKDKYFQVTVVFNTPTNRTVKSDILFSAYAADRDASQTNYVIKGDGSTETHSGKTAISWNSGKATATFWIKDTDTVTFTNIPYGVTYEVTEALPAYDTYQHTLVVTEPDTTNQVSTFNGIAVAADTSISTMTTDTTGTSATATGTMNNQKDLVTITNNKDVAIDIGVITENAPYVALMAVCAAAAVLMVTRKKRIFED